MSVYLRDRLNTLETEIQKLRAQLNNPELDVWPGMVVEVRNSTMGEWVVRKLMALPSLENGEYYQVLGGGRWHFCRPIQDHLLLQFKPHDWKNSPIPCDPSLRVDLMFHDRSIANNELTSDMDWVEVIGWRPTKGWGNSE